MAVSTKEAGTLIGFGTEYPPVKQLSLIENYEDKTAVMTDSSGHVHPWTNQSPTLAQITETRNFASAVLPPQFAEIVSLTERPFIQAISDVQSPQTVFFDGKLLLMGDAVAGFRPHTAGSTSQAAFHALLLFEYLRKEKQDWKAFEREVKRWADGGVKHGIQLGNQSQFGRHRMHIRLVLSN
jgi:2-polyprenyl-6-methoxyphenol hydroxylase-like FAD-dependent oxidoreductase